MIICSIKFNDLTPTSVFQILRFQFFFLALRFRVLQVFCKYASAMGLKKTGSRTRSEASIVCLLGGGGRRGREGKRERRRDHYMASQQSCRIKIRY
jgi:hypothetical protein